LSGEGNRDYRERGHEREADELAHTFNEITNAGVWGLGIGGFRDATPLKDSKGWPIEVIEKGSLS
jgi:hypothetical protein